MRDFIFYAVSALALYYTVGVFYYALRASNSFDKKSGVISIYVTFLVYVMRKEFPREIMVNEDARKNFENMHFVYRTTFGFMIVIVGVFFLSDG